MSQYYDNKRLLSRSRVPGYGMSSVQQAPPPPPPAEPEPVPTDAPPAAPAPPAKSRKGAIAAVVVVVIVVVAILAYFLFIQQPEEDGDIPTITYQELIDDLDIDLGTMKVEFESFDNGDKVNVVGTVENVRMANVPSGVGYLTPGPWTCIFFETTGISIWEGFAFEGDLQSQFVIGQQATITIKIVKTSALGVTMEYPDEALAMKMITSYMEVPNIVLEFTMTTQGNYTGSITSTSDTIRLRDLEIEIENSGWGWDDGDLTDDDPEIVDLTFRDYLLEFSDVNNDDLLDPGDTFAIYYAETGYTITLIDSLTTEDICVYTFP
jgi:hypothetical protein